MLLFYFILFFVEKIQRNPDATFMDALKDCQNLPSVDDLIEVYQTLSPAANVHIFTFVLLLSVMYEKCDYEEKAKILHFFFDNIFPAHFKKVRLFFLSLFS